MLKKILCVLLLAQAAWAPAQSLWTDVSGRNLPDRPDAQRFIIPRQYRLVRLDRSQLQPLLAAAPERFTPAAADHLVALTLPLPDGQWGRFRLAESPVMDPALQVKYPEIRCYTGIGVDDPGATLKCDFTPQGFHAMIQSAQHGTIFIDPYRQGDADHYLVYDKKDYEPAGKTFRCLVDDNIAHDAHAGGNVPELQGDCMLRRYRLALACTGEYAAFHGGTVPLALAAMATTVNRVNGIYERDLAITFQLIGNNNVLVFLNPNTDGYSNGNPFSMIDQNQSKISTAIGSGNYDIGHVFGTAGGGLASVGVVCGNSVKARGVTGTEQPIGDPFDIDYVTHEIGHQLGANHSFNNDCDQNVNPATAFEPGSGSTIMAYAGVCTPNVQLFTDAYFHAVSLQEIAVYTTVSQGNVCAFKINTGNTAPVVNAGADYIIPQSTPFALTATGSDANGDTLTYCWEQMNSELTTAPPASTSVVGPLFRSYTPALSPTRYFPRLADLVANVNADWEELPAVARILNFRVTARDNDAGGGCTEEDDMAITVSAAAGPFLVTAPNAAETWYVGDTKTVTWDVANTNAAPVNCAQVRLLLSTDGGFTYPVVLANAVPNTGSAAVDVPNTVSATCRVMVQAIGNIFFDISNQNFSIAAPLAPTFLLTTDLTETQVCLGTTAQFSAAVGSISGFDDPVQLAVTGAPAGATVNISANPVMPGNSATIELTGLVQPGAYLLTVTGTSDTLTRIRTVQLTVADGAPAAPALLSPADGAAGSPLSRSLGWAAAPTAFNYQVQVASSPSFGAGTILLDQTVTQPAILVNGLENARVYYWRVMAANACGQSAFGAPFAFQTGQPECGFSFSSTNVPLPIADNAVSTVASFLNIPANRFVADLNLSVQANHSWVGDLKARLIAPSGQPALLFDQPGYPATSVGCGGDNLNLTFDDEATLSAATLENTCGNLPALSGTYKSTETLDRFDNLSAQGVWLLEMTDNFPEDGGAITAWSLNFCFVDTVPATTLLVNNPLTVLAGGAPGDITTSHLVLNINSGNPVQGLFRLLSVPQHGALALNGLNLAVGDTFTQDDILAGTVAYTHNGDAAAADSFRFDATDTGTGGWIHDSTFHIVILQNDLAVSAVITQALLCAGDANGQISVAVTGGTPPLQYSLNGGANQFFTTFDNLPAGTYSVVVSDQNGFTAESNTVVLANPASISVAVNATNDDILCTASGGTGVLNYSLDGQVYQSNGLFENRPNGVYTVTVRDANGCTASATATVNVPPLGATATATAGIACAGNATGALTITASGGVPPYQYSLNGLGFQVAGTFTGLAAGTYTVVVKDDSGNTATAAPVMLNNPPVLLVSAAVNDDDVSVTASGGTGALSYSLDGQTFQSGAFFENLPNGFYTVTVRDANGCTATTEVVIAIGQLIAELKITNKNACAGDQNGALAVTAAGGVAPYSYSLNGLGFQPENTFEGLPAGVYTVVVKDDSGNTASSNTVTLDDPPAITATATATLNVITVTASGGTGVLQYSLNGQNFQSGSTFAELPNGDYTVTVQDANGCTTTVEVSVAVPPLQFVGVNVSGNINCHGDSIAITVLVTGGIPPYQYSLDGGPYQSESTFEGVGGGLHTVSVRDAAGSELQSPAVTLIEPPVLTASVLLSKNDLEVLAAGGTLPYTYSVDGGPFLPSNVFLDLPNGEHEVTVRDANGCTTTVSVSIDYEGLATTVLTQNPTCAGFANGSALVSVTGGTPPYAILGPVSDLPAGMYSLSIIDFGGDTAVISFTLVDPPVLTASAEAVQNTITVTAAGGTGSLLYSIDGLVFQPVPVFSDLPNGTYSVWVRDANGCLVQIDGLVVDVIGTVEPVRAWGLTVQPNPGDGLFRLTFEQAPAGALQAVVFDSAGRRVRAQVYEVQQGGSLSAALDLSGFPAGVYWLRLTNGTQVGGLRLVLQ